MVYTKLSKVSDVDFLTGSPCLIDPFVSQINGWMVLLSHTPSVFSTYTNSHGTKQRFLPLKRVAQTTDAGAARLQLGWAPSHVQIMSCFSSYTPTITNRMLITFTLITILQKDGCATIFPWRYRAPSMVLIAFAVSYTVTHKLQQTL